jgi:hypothetical protein
VKTGIQKTFLNSQNIIERFIRKHCNFNSGFPIKLGMTGGKVEFSKKKKQSEFIQSALML